MNKLKKFGFTDFIKVHSQLSNIYIFLAGSSPDWLTRFNNAKTKLLILQGWDEQAFDREREKLIQSLNLDPAYGPNADLL